MKKLLSIILSILMVASMFSMIAVPTVMAEDAATDGSVVLADFNDEASIPNTNGASFDNGAMKLDLSASGYNGTFNVSVDPSLVDATTLYTVNVGFKTQDMTDICFYVSGAATTNTVINGVGTRYISQPYRGEFILLGGGDKSGVYTTNLPTEYTEVVSNNDLMLPGNSTNLTFVLASTTLSGYAWIDYIKLVPVAEAAGGSVKVTGTDANGYTVYTATADAGFKVSDITANISNSNGSATTPLTIKEISRTDSKVKFIVDHTPTTTERMYDGYLKVNFVESAYIDEDGAIVLKNFDSAVTVPSIAGASFDNGAMKLDLSASGYNGTFSVSVDSALIDANTLYTINVGFKTQGMTNTVFGVTGAAQTNTVINGVAARYISQISRGEFILLGGSYAALRTDRDDCVTAEPPTEWTELVSNNDLMLPGNSSTLTFVLTARTLSGYAWIDYIKLVPVTKAVGGSVKVTGVDSNNYTVYTATADDGFKIGDIVANISNNTGTATTALTIKEISRTDSVVKFIVDYIPVGTDRMYDGYLKVNFEANESYVDSNGNIILKEFTALTADVAGNGREIDTENVYSGTSSLKISLADSTASGFWSRPGATLDIYPDTELLDVNKKYRVRVTYASDNQDATFRSAIRFFGTVNGAEQYATWKVSGANDFNFFTGTTLSTDWKQYTTTQTFSPFGNNFHIQLSVFAEDKNVKTGNVWIDKVELIPVEDNIDDGVVRVTGTTEDGATVYTAYANEGYTVDAINASAGQLNSATIHPLNVNIVEKVSDREVSFTVDSFDFDAGNRMMAFDVARYYIQVLFGSEMPMLMDSDEEYIISDLSENTYDALGNATAVYEEDIQTGVCYATEATETIRFYVDGNTIAKFDASNYYKLNALMQSTEDWQGIIYFKVRYGMGADTYALTENSYGEFYILGAKNAPETPDCVFGWNKYTSSSVFPVVGNYIQIEMIITRTSETGTLYIDNIGISANDGVGAVEAVDYSVQNGFVKSRYDLASNCVIYTPVAFEGYEYDNLTVKFRSWNSVVIDGVEVDTIYKAPSSLIDIKSSEVRSYAVDVSTLRPSGNGGRIQAAYAAERYITVSFREAVVDVLGDANSDSQTNILDFIKVKKHLADKTVDLRITNVDYNGTKTVDTQDIIALVKQLLDVTA